MPVYEGTADDPDHPHRGGVIILNVGRPRGLANSSQMPASDPRPEPPEGPPSEPDAMEEGRGRNE
jgi:hypothetical protein